MTFLVEALPEDTFQSLFALAPQDLAERGAARGCGEEHVAPCQISLEDAAPGER
ncbi:MAG: hypothetical protein U1E87_06980 [Alphaproteobacteria bacterium]